AGLNRHLQLNTASDVLYVSTPTGSIFRINSASTANTSTIPAAMLTLTVGVNDSVTDIALDATHDVLYVGFNRASGGTVGIIRAISGKTNGAVTLNAEITLSN